MLDILLTTFSIADLPALIIILNLFIHLSWLYIYILDSLKLKFAIQSYYADFEIESKFLSLF